MIFVIVLISIWFLLMLLYVINHFDRLILDRKINNETLKMMKDRGCGYNC